MMRVPAQEPAMWVTVKRVLTTRAGTTPASRVPRVTRQVGLMETANKQGAHSNDIIPWYVICNPLLKRKEGKLGHPRKRTETRELNENKEKDLFN